MENKFSGKYFRLTVCFSWFDPKMVWSKNFHFKPFLDSRVKTKRERERGKYHAFDFDFAPITLRSRLRLRTNCIEIAPIAPQDRTETALIAPQDFTKMALIALRSHPRIALISLFPDLVPPSPVDLMNFFWLGFASVFIYWEIVLYVCLEAEKMWEKCEEQVEMCFLYYFQQYNQTLENIFQSIFWNATKHLKIFFFPENSISRKYFTWTKHSLHFLFITNTTFTSLPHYEKDMFRKSKKKEAKNTRKQLNQLKGTLITQVRHTKKTAKIKSLTSMCSQYQWQIGI